MLCKCFFLVFSRYSSKALDPLGGVHVDLALKWFFMGGIVVGVLPKKYLNLIDLVNSS